MPRITILGSGFGAVATVRELRRRKVKATITVVSPRPELVYLPSLIWLPSGLRKGEDLRVPLQGFFERHDTRWQAGHVRGIGAEGRRVVTDDGELDTDYLVIATGARYLRRLPGIEHALIPCEGIEAAEAIRDRLAAMECGRIAIGFASNPQEPGAVRGGPMFEFLFGIERLLRRQGRRERFELEFFNPSEQPGQRLGGRAVASMLARMRRLGIETRLGHKPLGFEAGKVITEGGEIAAELILFMPGLTGPAWLDASSLPRSPGGFIAADGHCRVQDLESTYVVGHAGSYPGPAWMAKQAHQADLQARAVAANIASQLDGGEPATGFRTELACIVDALDSGMLVWRRGTRSLVLPDLAPLHWAKRRFEQRYLRALR